MKETRFNVQWKADRSQPKTL